MSDRVSISRALLRCALEDAIESIQELVGGGNHDPATIRRLAEYRRVLNRIAPPAADPEPIRTITLSEIIEREAS